MPESVPSKKIVLTARVVAALLGLAAATALEAQTLYWDANGSTTGAGNAPSGTWSTSGSDKSWNDNSTGTTGAEKWTNGRTAVFSAGTNGTSSYIVTVAGTVGTSGITIEEGTPTFTGGTINFSDASPDFSVANGLTATVNSVISGSNGLTKTGGGLLIFAGSAKTYTGTTTVNAGTLQLNASNLINDSSALAVASGATFALNWGVSETVGALSGAGKVDFRTGSLTVGSSANTTFSGQLANQWGTLVKQGTGSLTLSGANTYSGVTTINAGTLVAASDTALGTATWGNTIANGAALHLQNNITMTEGMFSVTGSGVGGTGAIRNVSGINTLNSAIDLAGNTTVASSAGTLGIAGQISLDTRTLTTAGAGNITLSGTITGSGGITKTGGGTLALSGGSGNSFGGALSITDGTVALAKSSGNALAGGVVNIGDGSGTAGSAVLRLDASHQIANHGGLVTIRSDGVLRVNNFTEGINTLAGTGLIDLSTSGYLTVGVNSGSSTFGGSITGSGTLEKAGSGTLTFNSNIGFTGTLALSGGTVALNGVSLSADTLIVSANSIIDFGGSASQLNLTNMAIAANVVLTIKNWAGAADFFFTQNWAGASFNTGGNNPMNQVVFQGFNANDTKWQSYDRQITPVPEPSAYGAMLLGMGVALSWIRRRRRRTA